MSSSKEDGHAKYSFRIGDDLLRKIRNGEFDSADADLLRARCKAWVKPFSTGLSREDREDVVSEAISEVMPHMLSPAWDATAVGDALRKHLQRLRARGKRYSFRMEDFDESAPDLAAANLIEDDHIATEDVLGIASLFRETIAKAILGLADRDHDLLVEEYHMESIGFDRRHVALAFATDGARRTALSRARTNFSRLLEAALMDPNVTQGHDPHLVEKTLLFLRGKKGIQALLILSDLEDASLVLRPARKRA